MTAKIAINGFGRIGRLSFRAALDDPDLDIVAINGTTDPETHAHLLKYDSVHGTFDGDVTFTDDALVVNGKEIKIFKERDPANIPWGDHGVDIVIEATGAFRDANKARAHIDSGAKKVLITAPAKNEDATIVLGVNEEIYDPKKHHIISNASCTTNCLAPMAKVIFDKFGIKRGLMTTVHSFTNDQNNLDGTHKDLRRARACTMSIIPTTTGAAKAVSLVIPELKGKLNGFAMRVPTPNVSVVDLVVETEKKTSVEEVNDCLREAANGRLKGIMDFSDKPLVSIDYNGDSHSCIVDGLSTMIIEDNMLKLIGWYDNEWGYSMRVVDFAKLMAEKGI